MRKMKLAFLVLISITLCYSGTPRVLFRSCDKADTPAEKDIARQLKNAIHPMGHIVGSNKDSKTGVCIAFKQHIKEDVQIKIGNSSKVIYPISHYRYNPNNCGKFDWKEPCLDKAIAYGISSGTSATVQIAGWGSCELTTKPGCYTLYLIDYNSKPNCSKSSTAYSNQQSKSTTQKNSRIEWEWKGPKTKYFQNSGDKRGTIITLKVVVKSNRGMPIQGAKVLFRRGCRSYYNNTAYDYVKTNSQGVATISVGVSYFLYANGKIEGVVCDSQNKNQILLCAIEATGFKSHSANNLITFKPFPKTTHKTETIHLVPLRN